MDGRIAGALLLAALATGLHGRAEAADKVQKRPTGREAVLKLLGASERAPTEKELRALGADTDRQLVAIADDAKVEPKMRARAVSALGFAPTNISRAYLTRLVAQVAAAKDETDLLLVRRAAVALGWQGGPAVPPALAGLLAHPDVEVRTDAAVALGLTRLASAADLLRARLDVETDARVRGHVSRQLRVVEDSLGLQPTP
jgi:HEAT repeat protein